MTNKELAIAVVKWGIIHPTLISAYAFIDAWSYLLFARHAERLGSGGIGVYEYRKHEVRRMSDGEDTK